jgi:uncharacterized membrane protein YdjX (TVP38/TMEM64 family)
MKEDVKQKSILRILRWIPLILVVGIATYIVASRGPRTIVATLEEYRDNMVLVTAVVLLLFLFKSVSFGLPYTLLYIAVGHIYPLTAALLLNTIGIAVNMQIPYLVGRYGSLRAVQQLMQRFALIREMQQRNDHSSLVFTFLIKFLGIVPHEITNLLLGSLHIPYPSYLAGGILGLLPGMLFTTLAGNSLKNPASFQFIGAITAFVALMVLSYYLARKVKRN